MVLGALLDLGIRLEDLRAALGPMLPEGAALKAERVMRSGIGATGFCVTEQPSTPGAGGGDRGHPHGKGHGHGHEARGHGHSDDDHHHAHGHGHHGHDHGHEAPSRGDSHRYAHDYHDAPPEAVAGPHRSLDEICGLIDRAAFPPEVRDRARALYTRLATVEAEIHQTPLDRVHLHEVGALDSVVDIVGAVWAFGTLGVDRIVASPLNVGGGRVRTAHGLLSVPAPATLRLLEGVPVYSDGTPFELVTPTGALLITGHATSFGPMPAMTVRRTGYGAGGRDLPDHPNVLRAMLGDDGAPPRGDRVSVMSCNIDDMNPQLFGVLMDRLYSEGALDVMYVPAFMKKNRPATLVTVLAPPSRREAVLGVLFRESTTIGVRHTEMDRECLDRTDVTVETEYGAIRVKVATRAGERMNVAPEYDDCVRAASAHGAAVKDVQAAACRAFLNNGGARR